MRKMLWGLAASALVLSSCSTNEVEDIVSGKDNPNAINFMTSTTKASINTITDVEGGFTVYAANGGQTPKWQFENKKYLKTGASWGFDSNEQVQWPTAEAGAYPLSFYAFFPQSHDGFGASALTAGTLTASITVQTPDHNVGAGDVGVVTTNQADFLAANNTVDAKPVGGYVSLTFGHIMSKINAAVVPGFNTKVYVQAVKFHGSKTTNTFTYNSKTWTGPLETEAMMQYANKAGAAYTVTATDKSFNFTGTDATETTAFPFYTMATPPVAGPNGHETDNANNLMLMPQQLTAWPTSVNPVKPTAQPATDQAYIEVIYRVTDKVTNEDLVGMTAYTAPTAPSTREAIDATPGRPLFVKVGFPLGTKWEQGKGYMYKLMLGTVAGTGGYYLDDKYYDENGNQTNITITDGKGDKVDPLDPVNKGTIDFIVDVTGWDDQEPGTIQ